MVLPLAPHLSLRVPREARQSSSCWRMILRACSGMSAGRVAKGRRGGRCGTWTYETARWQRVGRGPAHPAARKEGGGGIAGEWREAGPTIVELAWAPRECCSLRTPARASCRRRVRIMGYQRYPKLFRVECAAGIRALGGAQTCRCRTRLCAVARVTKCLLLWEVDGSNLSPAPFSFSHSRADARDATVALARHASPNGRAVRVRRPVPLGRANMDGQPFPGTRSPRLLVSCGPYLAQVACRTGRYRGDCGAHESGGARRLCA